MHSLKFEYTRIGKNYFPMIDVELISPKNSVITKAYVDSGATYSLFKSELAELIDIDYKKGKKLYPVGIGGHICAYLNKLKMKVGNIEFKCEIMFSDELIVRFNIIGRKGFFENFKVCYDETNNIIELFKK